MNHQGVKDLMTKYGIDQTRQAEDPAAAMTKVMALLMNEQFMTELFELIANDRELQTL